MVRQFYVWFPPDQRLDEQGVKNHSKMMVLKVSDAEQVTREEEEKKNQSESLQRTKKGFQILSERGANSLSVMELLLCAKGSCCTRFISM